MTGLRHLVRPRLLDPDKLRTYQRMRVENGALYVGATDACLTIWRLPTVNLDVASIAARRRHRAQWGAFLDGLGHEVSVVIRARRMRRLQAIYEVFEHGSDEARALARWLQGHLGDRPLIARERLLVIPAPDRATLQSRCADIRSSLAQFDWRAIEPESDNHLEQLVNGFWPLRPGIERLGPAMVQRKQRELIVDGEYVRVYALRDFPAMIATDWWSHLIDADLPVDVAVDIRPRDVGEGKRHLDRREIALATSRHTREREVALEQVRALAMAMERGQVKPFDVAVQTAYVTGAPVADWLGLATPSGREAIQLGEGCEGVAPGLNVVQVDAPAAELRLRIVDPVVGVLPAECVVVNRRHMSDVPCGQNPRGACDVAFAR